MRKKLGIVINCIWVLLVLLTGAADCRSRYRNISGSLKDTYMAQAEPFLYVADNTDGEAKLYRIDAEGELLTGSEAFGTGTDCRFMGITVGQNVYTLIREAYDGDDGRAYQYRISEYTQELKPVSGGQPIRLAETGMVTGFSVDESGYYLTVVDTDGTGAFAYRVSGESTNTAETETIEAEEVAIATADAGRTILQARYQRGRMLLYLDDGSGAEAFVTDEEKAELFYDRQVTLKQYLGNHTELLFRYIVILFSGLLFLVVVEGILRKKNRLICLIAAMEGVLLLAVVGNVFVICNMEYEKDADKRAELASVYLRKLAEEEAFQTAFSTEAEGYYDTAAYYSQYYAMRKLAYGNGVSSYFGEICLVRASDGVIVAGTGEWNGQKLSAVYTDAAVQLSREAFNEQRYAETEVKIGNRSYHLGSITVKGDDCVLLGVLPAAADLNEQRDTILKNSLIGLGVYLILSALGICFLTAQSRDIGKLRNALLGVADGRQEIRRPTVHGKEMESMWNSINEADKTLKKMNHSRLQLFEAYYRFAPKGIDTLLGKDSIMEVGCGDEQRLDCTMAIVGLHPAEVRLPEFQKPEFRNHFLQCLERRQQEQRGITVANNVELSELKLLFPVKKSDTVQFAVDLLRDFPEEERGSVPASIFLFRSQFVYGIAGSDTQCFPVLDTKNRFRQEEYAEWLGRLGLRLVVTEEIRENGCLDKDVRYLGYVPAEDRQIRLYEVLDACPNRERRAKLQTREKFEQALQLFYRYDFYLARSTFSEILRDYPEDQITKWYLFACERHLNEANGTDIDCGLHYN